MKSKSLNYIFVLSFFILLFSSCQNESIQESSNDPRENISEESDLLTYLRTTTNTETDNNNDTEDDCVDFEFPITFLVYDTDWEIVQTIDAESDQDISDILEMIDESTYVSINYPITLIYQSEVILTVNNNQELIEAFETYDEGCYDLSVLFGCAIDAMTVIDIVIQDDESPTDGIHAFSLDLEFFCNDIEYELQYFETTQDAESQTNPIVFPYTNNTNPQTIYVVASTEYEGVLVSSNVFEINVIIVDGETNADCNEWNVFEALVINESGWNITENNIFSENDNVNQYGISFSSDGSLVYGTESPSYLNTHAGTYNIFVSATGDTLAEFSFNDPNLPINPISDETWILTACDLVTGSFTFYQYDMTTGQQGDLYFVLSVCECEDFETCLETSLDGKWLSVGGDNTVEPNTMFIFEDGLRYTVYCTESCDWEALGIEDAIPTPLEYFYDYENCLLTTDLNFGNYVTWVTQFVCDEQVLRAYVLETGAEIIFYRPGYDISQCDE